ncbi:MAG: DNA-binding domain-containing protein [Polyangiaceae bacterium]
MSRGAETESRASSSAAAPGVPLEGGSSEAIVRQRASATPRKNVATGSPTESAGARCDHETLARGAAGRDPHHDAHGSGRAAHRAPPLQAPLSALQHWFAGVVMHPSGVTAGVEALHGAKNAELGVSLADAERVLLPSSRLTGLARVAIYGDAYRARLVECLADDYPALQYALGHHEFEALCLRYIARHPSQSPNLNAFGRHMAAFCRTEESPARLFEGDLAALEWAMVEVLHAAQPEKLDLATLATVPPERWGGARFSPGGAVRVLEFAYPVNAFFQAFRTDNEPTVPEPAWSATAVFRDGTTIWRMDLSRAMHALLTMLSGGTPLGAALDLLASSGHITEEEGAQVMVWFRDWVSHGFFAGIETG